jgi:glycerophosphoryl diester phosphodiesterase
VSLWARSPLVVGHRGGRGDGWPPENTLRAFERAYEQGARAIELDVRTCAGGEVVVFHDETLERVTQGRDRRRVRDLTWEHLAAVDLRDSATIPTLVAALAWARTRGVAVNVEMKHDVPHRSSLARATLADIRASGADVLLSSFDPFLLAMAAVSGLAVPRALLTHARQRRTADALQELARPPVVRALHVERAQATAEALARYRRRGLRIGVWTVNDPDEARQLVRLGAATIISDRPGDILRALDPT